MGEAIGRPGGGGDRREGGGGDGRAGSGVGVGKRGCGGSGLGARDGPMREGGVFAVRERGTGIGVDVRGACDSGRKLAELSERSGRSRDGERSGVAGFSSANSSVGTGRS